MEKSIKRQIEANSCLLNTLLKELDSSVLAPYYCLLEAESVQHFLADSDLISTVEGFLENNLNISKTSKKTFMHRNTLQYRIEKIKRMLGLDIRKFEDAVTLKIILVLNGSKSKRKF